MTQLINSIPLKHLTVALHNDFHNKVSEAIADFGAEALHIAQQAAAYAELIERENSIVKRQTAYVSTIKLKVTDRTRDNGVGVVMQLINTHKTSIIPAKRKAAHGLAAITANYKGIARHHRRTLTREIDSLLAVLDTETARTHLATLAMTDEVEALRTANAQFETAMNEKVQEVVERAPQTSLNTLELRAAVDQAYAAIVRVINAYAVVQSSPQVEEFIAQVNALISLTRQIAEN